MQRPTDLRRVPWKLRYEIGRKLMSDWRRVSIEATHRHTRVEFRGPVRIGPGFELDILEHGTLVVGSDVQFRRGFVCEIAGAGHVEIGDGSVFTAQTLLLCSTRIEIGKRCSFGQSTLISDGFHRFRDWTRHLMDQGSDLAPVTIEDGANVAAKSSVSADLGRGCLIGGHSLVNSPIPAYCFAVGTPARIKEYFGPPEQRPAELDA